MKRRHLLTAMVGTGLVLFGLGGAASADVLDFYGGPTYAGGTSSASYSGGTESLVLNASSSSFKVSDLTTSTVLLGPTSGSASINVTLNGYTPAGGTSFGAQYSSGSQGTGTASFTETVGSGLNEYILSASGSATWYETPSTIWLTLPSFTYTAPGDPFAGGPLMLELQDVSGLVTQSPLTTAIQTDAMGAVPVPLPASAAASAGLLAVLGLYYGLCRRRRSSAV